jgi:co-chaperonin GroES (HSP10)
MKFKVVGPRILLKVKKYSKNKDQTFEGSMIVMPETQTDLETVNQCVGEVVELGDMAYKRDDAFCNNKPWVKIGDKIHFCRHGAMRLHSKDEDLEYWVIMDKDILVIEEV